MARSLAPAQHDSPSAACLFEVLEPRRLLSVSAGLASPAPVELAAVTKMMVAGDPNGTPTDSPALRVDANTTSSPYAGVGSVFMETSPGQGYIGSAAPFTSTHIITAGHNVDLNNDGVVDVAPGSFRFILNFGGNITHQIFAKTIHLNPQYTGFANPAVNDDMAIIELSSPLPAGVPIYPLYTTPFSQSSPQTLTMVGYGQSGYGTSSSYSVGAAFDVKRQGRNVADRHETDDEGSSRVEVFEFVTVGGQLQIFGVNTYGFGNIVSGQIRNPPRFGSGSGGIVVSAYMDWINSVLGGGGGGENQAPVANNDSGTTNKKGVVKVNVLANDSDPDGDALTVTLSSTTTANGGTLVRNADQTITYTNKSGFKGVDTFTYSLSDGDLSDTATVSITVGNAGGGGPRRASASIFSPEASSVRGFAPATVNSLFAERAINPFGDLSTDEQDEDAELVLHS